MRHVRQCLGLPVKCHHSAASPDEKAHGNVFEAVVVGHGARNRDEKSCQGGEQRLSPCDTSLALLDTSLSTPLSTCQGGDQRQRADERVR